MRGAASGHGPPSARRTALRPRQSRLAAVQGPVVEGHEREGILADEDLLTGCLLGRRKLRLCAAQSEEDRQAGRKACVLESVGGHRLSLARSKGPGLAAAWHWLGATFSSHLVRPISRGPTLLVPAAPVWAEIPDKT